MKKKLTLVFALVAIFALAVICGACDLGTPVVPGATVHQVTFYGNYAGSENNTVLIDDGKTVEKPTTDPTRDGYIFAGWFTDYSAQTEYDFTAKITEDTKIFAGWRKTQYQVTLVYNNGDANKSDFVSMEEAKYSKPTTDPTRSNYKFRGWYTDRGCTNEYNFSTSLSDDLTLYAGWQQVTGTVIFELNYTGAPAAKTDTFSIENGEKVTEPTPPERELFRFDGWYVSRASDAKKFDFDTQPESDVILYARWERTHYLVTFNPNYTGGESDSQAVEVGGAADTESLDIARVGHDFVGWYNDDACTSPADLSKVNDNITVYAKWDLHTYQVDFDLNYAGATGTPATQSVKYGELVATPTAPTREGFVFAGWYTEAEGGAPFRFDTAAVASDLKLYARWRDAGAVGGKLNITMKFMDPTMGNGGVYQTYQIDALGTASDGKPDNPNLPGYYFGGWFEDAAGTIPFSFTTPLEEDTEIYAKMMKIYTFEAEATNLKGKSGQGSSCNYFEHDLIIDGDLIDGWADDHSSVSGNHYISGLYYTGAFLEWEITSDKEVSDAVLIFRITSEIHEFTGCENHFTPEVFQVIVNGTYDEDGAPVTGEVSYEGFDVPLANTDSTGDADPEKTPFEDVLVMTNLHLNKGLNKIRLRVNNTQNLGGTFNAYAPMFDCIRIYSDAKLTMTEYPEWLQAHIETKCGLV